MVRVRDATREDMPWLLSELKRFADSYGTRRNLFNREAVTNFVHALIDDHLLLIAEREFGSEEAGAEWLPVGLLGATITDHQWNPLIPVASECFWWVPPEQQGRGVGGRLVLEYRTRARELVGVGGWVSVSVEENSAIKPESLKKLGFKPKERSFLMEVE